MDNLPFSPSSLYLKKPPAPSLPPQSYPPPTEFSALPVNIKSYMSALMGNRSGPSIEDFSPGDLDAIRTAVGTAASTSRAVSNNPAFPPQGTIGYGEYTGNPRRGSSRFDEPQSLMDLLARSFTDPSFRAETTLGQAGYQVTPTGELLISDTYNFNRPRAEQQSYVAGEGIPQVIKDLIGLLVRGQGPAALESVANLGGPARDEGRPYTLNLGQLRSR